MNMRRRGPGARANLRRGAVLAGCAVIAVASTGCGVDGRSVSVVEDDFAPDPTPDPIGGSGGRAGAETTAGTPSIGGAPGEAAAGASGSAGAMPSGASSGPLPVALPGPDAGAIPEEAELPPGNYLQSGDFRGFVTVTADALGSTVSPTSFEERVPGEPFCISGTVAPDEFYGGFALLTFYLQQPLGGGPSGPASPVVPAGESIRFDLLGTDTGGVLRTQLVVDDVTWWCQDLAPVSGAVTLAYSDFREQCWLPVGETTAYTGAPIQAIRFAVPGAAADWVTFDFCVDALAELP